MDGVPTFYCLLYRIVQWPQPCDNMQDKHNNNISWYLTHLADPLDLTWLVIGIGEHMWEEENLFLHMWYYCYLKAEDYLDYVRTFGFKTGVCLHCRYTCWAGALYLGLWRYKQTIPENDKSSFRIVQRLLSLSSSRDDNALSHLTFLAPKMISIQGRDIKKELLLVVPSATNTYLQTYLLFLLCWHSNQAPRFWTS